MRQAIEEKLNRFLDLIIPILERKQMDSFGGESETPGPGALQYKNRKALLREWIRQGKSFTIGEIKDEMKNLFPLKGAATRNSILNWTYLISKEEGVKAVFSMKEQRFRFTKMPFPAEKAAPADVGRRKGVGM